MSEPQYVPLGPVLLPPISGKRPSGGVSSDTDGVPSIGGENILSSGGMTYEELKRIPYSFFKFMPKGRLLRDDVLINKDGAQTGKVGFYEGDFEEAAVNEHVFILRSRDPNYLNQRYLYYCVLLPETRNKIERRITGSAQPGLNSQFVKAVDVPLQPLSKQQKIAAILSGIDTAIEKTEALIAKYQQIKAGLMHDLFTRGVLPNGQLRPPHEQAPELYQETAIGWIPREWDVKPCADLCSRICVGIVIQPTQYYVEDGVPAFRSANVREDGIDPNNFVYISVGANRLLAKSQVKTGDIVSVRTGYPGTSAVIPSEFQGANCIDILISTPNEKVISEYLCDWINSSFGKGQVLRQQGGMAQQHFNVGEMRELLVALPDLNEQERIRTKIKSVSGKLAIEKALAEKLQAQKSGLMHDLLTGKVPVKVEEAEVVDG